MASINYVYEHLSSSATAMSLTPIDVMETSQSLRANKKYLILITAGVGGASNSSTFIFQAVIEGATLVGSTNKIEPNNSSIPHSYSFATVYTPSSSSTIKIQAGGNASINAELYRCEILALDLSDLTEGDDYFYETNTSLASNGSSWASRVEKTITPSSNNDGDWLIVAGCNTQVNDVEGSSYQMQIKQEIGTGRGMSTDSSPILRKEGEDLDETFVDFLTKTYNVLESDDSTKWYMQTRDNPVDTVSAFESGYLIGLRTSVFLDVTSSWNEADVSVTSSYTDLFSGSHSSTNVSNVVFLGSAIFDCASPNRSVFDKFLWDSSEAVAMPENRGNRSADSLDELPFHSMGLIESTSSGSHSYNWQSKTSPGGLPIEDRSLVIFSTEYDPNEVSVTKLKSVGRVVKEKSTPKIPTIGKK